MTSYRVKNVPWQFLPTLLLFLAIPFEVLRPWLNFGWVQFTNLELFLLFALVGWLIWTLRTIRLDLPPNGPMAAVALFLVLGVLSALLAPAGQADALKFMGRLALALTALPLTFAAVRATGSARPWLWALCLGGLASGLLALAEAASIGSALLGPFKIAPSFVGGDLRVSGTFQYATIAGAYFELLLPLALGLAATTRRRSARGVALVTAVVALGAIVLSQTRASLLTAAAILLLLAIAGRPWPALRRLQRPVLLAGAALVAFVLLQIVQSPGGWTRLTTVDAAAWYDASYAVPATITAEAGVPVTVAVTVTNRGSATWPAGGPRPFGLLWRWYDDAGQNELDQSRGERLLTQPVPPGANTTIAVTIMPALPAGTYQLFWSMGRQGFLSFHENGVEAAFSTVVVKPGAAAWPAPQPRPTAVLDANPRPVPRPDLWRAAIGLFRQRPWLGHGPDQFRHLYGPELGLMQWDDRVHSNSLYLELLANHGLFGLLSFAGILAAVGWSLRRRQSVNVILTAVVTVSLLGWLGHGLLDYFLSFTGTGLLYWILVGLLVAGAEPSEDSASVDSAPVNSMPDLFGPATGTGDNQRPA